MKGPKVEGYQRPLDNQTMISRCLNCKKQRCDHGTCAEIKNDELSRYKKGRRDVRLYYMDGETHPLSFWASMYGLSQQALALRIKQCGSLEMALKKPAKQSDCQMYTAFGYTLSVSEWANLCDVSVSTIRYRLKSGRPLEFVFKEANRTIEKRGKNQ